MTVPGQEMLDCMKMEEGGELSRNLSPWVCFLLCGSLVMGYSQCFELLLPFPPCSDGLQLLLLSYNQPFPLSCLCSGCFLKVVLSIYVCGCFSYMFTCVAGIHGDQKRMLDPLGLELQMIESCHVGGRDRTWVFWQNIRGSEPLRHLSSPC